MDRRHEIAVVPILSRFGLQRPDERPLPFGDAVAAQVGVGGYETAAPGWGRALQFSFFTPAVVARFGFIAIDPPENGAWIKSVFGVTGGGGGVATYTSNQVAEPGFVASGTAALSVRYDGREPAPPFTARTGTVAAVPAGGSQNVLITRPIWWSDTVLYFVAGAVNDSLVLEVALDMPFQGARRTT